MMDAAELAERAEELKGCLLDLAERLDCYYEKGNQVKAAGSIAAVAGGTLAVVAGVAVTMTTFGMAAPLAATGAAVATAGSLTSGGVTLANYIVEKRVEKKWTDFKKQLLESPVLPSEFRRSLGGQAPPKNDEIQMDEIVALFQKQKGPTSSSDDDDVLNPADDAVPPKNGKMCTRQAEKQRRLTSYSAEALPEKKGAVGQDEMALSEKEDIPYSADEMARFIQTIAQTIQKPGHQDSGQRQDDVTETLTKYIASALRMPEKDVKRVLNAVVGMGKGTIRSIVADMIKERVSGNRCGTASPSAQLSGGRLPSTQLGGGDLGADCVSLAGQAWGYVSLVQGLSRKQVTSVLWFCAKQKNAICDILAEDRMCYDAVDVISRQALAKPPRQASLAVPTLGIGSSVSADTQSLVCSLWERGKKVVAGSRSLTNKALEQGMEFAASGASYIPDSPKSVASSLWTTGAMVWEGTKSTACGAAKKGGELLQAGAGYVPEASKSLVSGVWSTSSRVVEGSKTLAYGAAQRGVDVVKAGVQYIPPSATKAGTNIYQTSKGLASTVAQRGVGVVKAGAQYLPPSAAKAGTNMYQNSKGLASGLAQRGWGLASQAKTWFAGAGNGGAGGTAAAVSVSRGAGLGKVTGLVTAVSRPIVLLNAAVLPLSVYELVKVSVELHNKTKSRAGDFLREIVQGLDKIIQLLEVERSCDI